MTIRYIDVAKFVKNLVKTNLTLMNETEDDILLSICLELWRAGW